MYKDSNSELVQEIARQIDLMGGLTFAEYMQQALYHPEYGYYTTPRTRIGKQGDFFTSSSVHSCFGRLIARQLIQMWQILGSGVFTIAEQGAGEGHLCLDILDAISEESPDFYASLVYRIVEISDDNRTRQAELLQHHVDEGRVHWCDLADLKGMEGCFLSNELIDAFPVHIVEKQGGELKEVYVVNKGDGFGEELRRPSTAEIENYFDQAGIAPIEGNRCEVNLNAGLWMRQVTEVIKRGFALTIDYGYTAEELYAPSRHSGTFLCYHRHQTSDEPYERVGHQDMTSHVDFSHLQNVGGRRGLKTLYFGQQYQFLMALGFLELLIELESRESDPQKAQALRMNLKNLILPDGGMGESFRVLIQGKMLAVKNCCASVKFRIFVSRVG